MLSIVDSTSTSDIIKIVYINERQPSHLELIFGAELSLNLNFKIISESGYCCWNYQVIIRLLVNFKMFSPQCERCVLELIRMHE